LGPVSPILLGREQHLRMVPHQTSAFHPLQTLAELAGVQVKRQLASVSSPMEV
jgi:hypothetical protein